MPAVSVIIVTYNRADLLPRCLKSVFGQAFGDLEVIVVDDGSTDSTPAVLFSVTDPRLRALRLKHSGNIAHLRNVGLATSTAPLIAFLDSDDEWLPEKLNRQIAAMTRHGADFTYTNAMTMTSGREESAGINGFSTEAGQHATLHRLFTHWILLPSTLLFSKELVDRTGGFREDLVAIADAEFMLRMLRSGRALGLDESLTIRHRHSRQHSSSYASNAYSEMLRLAGEYRHAGILSPRRYATIASTLAYRRAKADARRTFHWGQQS